MKSIFRVGSVVFVLACLGCGGCASLPDHPPRNLRELEQQQKLNPQDFTPRTIALYNVGRVLSKSLSAQERLDSLRMVEKLEVSAAEACPALSEVLVEPDTPPAVRQEVMAFLAGRRYGGLEGQLAAMLPQAEDPKVRLAMLELMEVNPSPKVLADIVKLWAAQPRLPEEEEARYRRMVAELCGKKWDQALLEGLNTRDFFARGSAVEILSARLPAPVLRRMLAELQPRTEAVLAMQTFSEAFDYVPKTGRELLAAVAAQAKGRRALLPAAELTTRWRAGAAYAFNIRDLHLLGGLSGDPMRNTGMSRVQLALEISRAIGGRRENPIAGTGADSSRRPRFRRGRLVDFDAQVESLSIADLWRLLLLGEMFSRPSIREAFRIAALQDRADGQTQWGGLVSYTHGIVQAKLYPPGAKQGDDQYVPSKQMMWDAFDSVCFFVGHFRTQVEDPAWIGPSVRELALAKSQNVCGVVVTSLTQGKLNVTYFTPGRVLIDLGNFPPPK
ncbi:MAG: hypothetical protein AMJ81_05280 [Phycisphaerae bacterium SM23_33]|nr:MAG: hypothetical protein AMJ81_05280 [Phycisphaerae bacterium SM23_33]